MVFAQLKTHLPMGQNRECRARATCIGRQYMIKKTSQIIEGKMA